MSSRKTGFRDSLSVAGISLLLALLAVPAVYAVEEYQAPLLQVGEDERVEGTDPCPQEADFVAGTISSVYSLKVGGNAYGCDSEWGVSAEFDLSALNPGQTIFAAEFIVRKTGHEEGLPYVAAYAYEATGGEVLLPRVDLDMYTALDIVAPTQANVDLYFTMTEHVQELVDDGASRVGVFLCGVHSEVGRMDRIYVGGSLHDYPPRLVITTDNTVAGESSTWSGVKSIYR